MIGFTSSIMAYLAVTWLKFRLGYDDALDVVGVHGVGGLVGVLLVSFFASSALGGSIEDLNTARQLGVQAFAALVVIIYCAVISFVILKLIDATIGLRVKEEEENMGLDLTHHGETGYDL